MTTTTTTPTEEIEGIDARSEWQRQLDALDTDEFSEAEMNMIDVAAVHVYKRARAGLPSELIDFTRDGDPAGVIRQWAYQWAHEHPHEVHERSGGRIVKHVRRRLRQDLDRYLKDRKRELPGTGFNLEAAVRGMEIIAEEKREKGRDIFTTTRPVRRPQPIKYRQDKGPLESEAMLTMIDLYGRFIPEDQQQFIIKRHRDGRPVRGRNGRPVRETGEALAKLHTRRPTRAEYWNEMFDGNSRKSLRRDLREDTDLHANTVAEIAEDVVPAVAERFADEARPVDRADVDRQRLRITSEEVRRVLLERFDVLYDD